MSDDQRLFTVDEANELLATLAPTVEEMRDAQTVMEELHDEVMASVPANGGGEVHRRFQEAAKTASEALTRLTEQGIIVRDPASGLIDFASERDGRVVFLCWKVGEDKIGWWHPPDTGFAGRQPL